jgi:hypothetical protein
MPFVRLCVPLKASAASSEKCRNRHAIEAFSKWTGKRELARSVLSYEEVDKCRTKKSMMLYT